MSTHPSLRWLALPLALATAGPGLARAAVRAQVLDAAWVQARCIAADDGSIAFFASLGGLPLQLFSTPAAAGSINPTGDGSFHPFTSGAVRAALDEMPAVPGPDVCVTIYCLPGLPRDARASFASGHEIFLAAGVGEIAPRVAAYTVVHELGHVIQRALLPVGDPQVWGRYLQARSLVDASRYYESAPHRNRPAEIFAEDFRMLFGGPLATASGTIENPDLPLPQAVPGLAELVAELLTNAHPAIAGLQWNGNHPNPFNPSTTIRFLLRGDLVVRGGAVRVGIFDARGRRVRALPPIPVAPEISARWDGTDERGQPVATGRYFVRAVLGGEVGGGAILLVK